MHAFQVIVVFVFVRAFQVIVVLCAIITMIFVFVRAIQVIVVSVRNFCEGFSFCVHISGDWRFFAHLLRFLFCFVRTSPCAHLSGCRFCAHI